MAAELQALGTAGAQVVVDFTRIEAARQTLAYCAGAGIHAVVGTTGFSEEDLAELGRRLRRPGQAAAPTASWPPTSPSGPC